MRIPFLSKLAPAVVLFLYFIGFVFLAIDHHISNKIINLVGMFSLLVVLLNPAYYFKGSKGHWIFIAILILGILNLSWYGYYKTPEVIYKNAYRGYLEMGKMAVFSAFSFLILTHRDTVCKFRYHLFAACIGQVILLSRAFYQGIYIGAERIPLSAMDAVPGTMGAATIAAYIITFSAIYASCVILMSDLKYKVPLFFLNFILSFSAVVMTGTRAAIFAYPLVTFLSVVIRYRKRRTFLLKTGGVFFSALIFCGFLFKNEIEKRLDILNRDIVQYEKGNSNTSVGARFAMTEAGFSASPTGFKWQSLESRGKKIEELAREDAMLRSAVYYLDIHMHNEIIEALSTKGIGGVIVLLLFYLSIGLYAYKVREPLVLMFLFALVLFGISDVTMHAKPIPSAWIVCLYLFCSLVITEKRRAEV
ncbi:O-antigen ligase domain-containing protein [Erwinia sp. CPCC 100877]|nr:O-antigen ligase domain-containing protein [Erwinia sp. CPCC 100877]